MNNLPIYRAKKLDSDKYAIGYYIPNYVMGEYESEDEDEREEWTEHLIIESFSQDLFVDDESYYNHDNSSQIDPTTLQISFDRAKWFDIERINKIMENQVNCTTCNDTGINHHNQPKPNKYKSVPCECKQKE